MNDLLFGLCEFSLLDNSKGDSSKTSAVWLVDFFYAVVGKSLKEAVADPTCVQSTLATILYGVF